jgi:hypothetical protein
MKELYRSMTTVQAMNTAVPESREHFAFGVGRRSCSGMHVAQNSLFINIARTLWGFNVSKSRDPVSGEVIEPETATENGFLAIPQRFPCRIQARSRRHAEVMEAWAEAQREGVSWSRRKTTI